MRKLLAVAVVTHLIACENEDLGLQSNPIDSKILIETKEVLEPTSRRVTFFCKTEKVYRCINFPLLTENKIDETSYKITFTSVGETVSCYTALGPATTSVDLNNLPNGEYALELDNASLKNNGILKITNSDIDLIFEQEKGIEIVRPNTKRVPDKTYWGTIRYDVQSSSTLTDAFLQKLVDKGAVFSKQTPGHYFYYEINNAGDIVANAENSGDDFLRAFIFQYDGNESELKDVIQIDGKDYRNELLITLQTYKGEQISN